MLTTNTTARRVGSDPIGGRRVIPNQNGLILYFKHKLKLVWPDRQQLFESQYKIGVADCVTRNFAAVLMDDLMPRAKDKVHAILTAISEAKLNSEHSSRKKQNINTSHGKPSIYQH